MTKKNHRMCGAFQVQKCNKIEISYPHNTQKTKPTLTDHWAVRTVGQFLGPLAEA